MRKQTVTIDGVEIEVVSSTDVQVEIERVTKELTEKYTTLETSHKNTLEKNARITKELAEANANLSTLQATAEKAGELEKTLAEKTVAEKDAARQLRIHEVLGGKYTGKVLAQLMETKVFKTAELDDDAKVADFEKTVDSVFGSLAGTSLSSPDKKETPQGPTPSLENIIAARVAQGAK
jgi:hypothetical protein